MLLAVLLDFILPLSGLLYDNLYAKSEPGWHVGGGLRVFGLSSGQISTYEFNRISDRPTFLRISDRPSFRHPYQPLE